VEYVTKIKVWDKNSALEKIAKHLGLFVDRIEHGVTGEVADLLKAINGRTRGLPNGG
ncbi:MAG: terminase small subunit, partial [Mesorhizobium sp.]